MEYKTLLDENKMPLIGIGTFRISRPDVEEAVCFALQNGYSSVDTANVYFSEEAAGRGIKKSGRDRESLFITSKIFPNSFKEFDKAVEGTLDRLGLDYLDLLLLHRPYGNYVQAYKRLIEAQRRGLVRSIGVSNFSVKQIEELISATGVIPAVNQIECNPLYGREGEVEPMIEKGIAIESWYPFGGGKGSFLGEEALVSAANNHHKSVQQVILRYLIEKGYVAIPGSKTPSHIKENIDIFDFSLTKEEKEAISKLSIGKPKEGIMGALTYRLTSKNYYEKKRK